MQRNGTAKDVAQAVAFFATTSNFVTGQILASMADLGSRDSRSSESRCGITDQRENNRLQNPLLSACAPTLRVALAAGFGVKLERNTLPKPDRLRLRRPLRAFYRCARIADIQPVSRLLARSSRPRSRSPSSSAADATRDDAHRWPGNESSCAPAAHPQTPSPSFQIARTATPKSPAPGILRASTLPAAPDPAAAPGLRSGCVMISV